MKFGCKAKTSCAEGGLSVKNLANMAGLQFHQKLKTIQLGNLIVEGNEIRRVTRAKNPVTRQRNYGLSSKQGTKRPHFCNINDRGRLVAEFLLSNPRHCVGATSFELRYRQQNIDPCSKTICSLRGHTSLLLSEI